MLKKKQKRSTSVMNMGSFANDFTFSTASTESMEKELKVQSLHNNIHENNPNVRIVNEIINKIFDDKKGFYDASSSHCSSVRRLSSEYSFDKRLQYWKNELQERRKLATKIRCKTGKHPSAVLFNRMTTVDERDKQTVKRLMDYAQRLRPDTLINKKKIRLRERTDPCDATKRVNELFETLPTAEQRQCKIVEISGLPAISKQEQLGREKEQGQEKRFQWMKSEYLESRIDDKREDLERVIEYYPDIDNLQVIGESLAKTYVFKHNSEIRLLHEEHIMDISSDTSLCEEAAAKLKVHELEQQKQQVQPPEYAMKINDQIFILMAKRSSKNVEVKIPFVCEPFETVAKRVLRIENIGCKTLNCEWVHRAFFVKAQQLLKPTDKEFLFNRCPFRLIAGEVRDLVVTFQPRKVDVFREKWLLKIDPQFFCRKLDGVVVKLIGRCKPPPEYVRKLNDIENCVIAKSNLKAMKSLTNNLGSITPLVKPNEVVCPYTRLLSERELFEFNNEGYKCERFHDLELLKDIYKRVKKPREPAWDLKLETLKALILRVESATRRALLFAEMVGILQEMKGKPAELEVKLVHNPERDQTRFVYVRGIIATSIDEWEDLAANIEEVFIKPAIKEYYEQLMGEEEEEEEGAFYLVDEVVVRKMLMKRIYRRKAFRDTLYVQTYTHLCNSIEDIVSSIESTEIV